MIAIYLIIDALKQYLSNKMVHIYTDNEPAKYMLINMRSKLKRFDLQLIINSICFLAIKYKFNIWIDHIKGDDNYIADALSRYIPLPSYSPKLHKKLNTFNALSNAIQNTQNILIENKYLSFDDD